MIDIIGVPFDLCGKRLGSRLGPAALRLAGLNQVLHDLHVEVNDMGDLDSGVESTQPGGLRNFEPLLGCLKELKARVRESLQSHSIPVVLGGDHSLPIASVAAALEVYEGDIALLWIDAHADLNTPGTSSTGNIHGMPVAALQRLESGVGGVADVQWSQLLSSVVPHQALSPERCAWYGLRDVDPLEGLRIRQTPGDLAITMHDVDRRGVVETIAWFDQWMKESGARHLWISFDVDALDPILAPGTGTAVRGGLSYRESHLVAELLRECLDARDCPYRLIGLDLVETNPLFDSNNETAKMAVEWVGSLFGKTILGGKSPQGGQ
ncbi:MAG: hypothetical protein BGO01_03505 [Armatimonadetes bacterium 55-13]|nr:arginase [Armatimonadota bacterium]OJU63016.1 MAG: hypothetical protein BGO01_03505 [Armatimonadetes bacterium 55-13]